MIEFTININGLQELRQVLFVGFCIIAVTILMNGFMR